MLPIASSRLANLLRACRRWHSSSSSAATPRMPRLEQLRHTLQSEAAAAAATVPARGDPAVPRLGTRAAATPLVDTHNRVHTYLRVSLTERCNLRCTYCMPPEGVALSQPSHLLTADEMVQLVEMFAALGITKVRLTGGEPTTRRDIVHIVQRLSAIPGLTTVAMTSNGVKLSQAMIGDLRAAGLTHLNISLDTFDRDKFAQATRRPAAYFDRVVAALAHAQHAGFEEVKVNVVAMKGFNDYELPAFLEFSDRTGFPVRFIELMPFHGNSWDKGALLSRDEQVTIIRRAYPTFQPLLPEAAGPPAGIARRLSGGTSETWHVPGMRATIGFITTMTSAFCDTCNRLRLTADGSVRACLHGDEEVSLRDALRRGDLAGVEAGIRAALRGKHAMLGGKFTTEALASAAAAGGRPMTTIGG